MKMEDLKFKVDYNYGADCIVIIGSLSNFQEEGSANCVLPRAQFLANPAPLIENTLNNIVKKLQEVYINIPISNTAMVAERVGFEKDLGEILEEALGEILEEVA